MIFVESVTTCLTKKYANFSGRAVRSEYWWFMLALLCAYTVLMLLLNILNPPKLIAQTLGALLFFASFLPMVAVGVRRLHDIGRSGWWFLLHIVGLSVIPFFLACMPSAVGANKYGEQS